MAGKAGRSGRRGYLDEIKHKKIIDLCSSTIRKALEDETLDLEFRCELAKTLYAKAMPQAIDHEGISSQIIQIIRPEQNGISTQTQTGSVRVFRSAFSSNGISLGNGKESLPDLEGTSTL